MRSAILLTLGIALLVFGCSQVAPTTNNTGNQSGNLTIPPGYEVKDYCQADSDCVRLDSCCDCGLGTYVNVYNQNNFQCNGPRCECAEELSKGVCQDNRCVAVAAPLNGSGTGTPAYNYTFGGGSGYCGSEIAPMVLSFDNSTQIAGAMGTPNPCYGVTADFRQSADGRPVLELTSAPLETFAACKQCGGAVQWRVNVTDYTGVVDVYYNGKLEQPGMQMELDEGQGRCGNGSAPIGVTDGGLNLSGAIGTSSVCQRLAADLELDNSGTPILGLSTWAIPGVDTCINCKGEVPWNAYAPGFGGPIQVEYFGSTVYPPQNLTGFCGSSTGFACDTAADCTRGGCSGEVCQGANESPAITSCIIRDCYDAKSYGLSCGCVNHQCQWDNNPTSLSCPSFYFFNETAGHCQPQTISPACPPNYPNSPVYFTCGGNVECPANYTMAGNSCILNGYNG